ncbi:hypothetical protein BDZ94DRAFT_114301 [Collybia nuda]|uniref:F-box domain-containing protein n=1 Tax=Collybia nuda TaxID=64659 RepID=A0A9P5XZ10_9AGAR|nr:hypothetical protein BDZ94DRAFT_114301 [Collybia nuda]
MVEMIQPTLDPPSDNYIQVDRTQNQPPEIMARIFWHVSNGVVMLPPTKHRPYPWALSHVCSRWKQILWSFPELCESLIIDHDPSGPRAVKNTRECLSYVLTNTKAPISMSIFCTDPEDLEISDIILAHVRRFSNLDLFNVSQQLLFSLWNLPPGSFEQLERIHVAFHPDDTNSQDDTISAFESGLKLRSVTYTANIPRYHRQMLHVPRSTLSELYINIIPVPAYAVHDILLSCTSLVKCSFTIGGTDTIPFKASATLPNIEELTLEVPDYFDWTGFFTPFRTPHLEHLSISSHGYGPPTSMFTYLMLQLKGPLRYLSVYFPEDSGDDIDHIDIGPLLEGLPSLTTLRLRAWIIPPFVFRNLQTGSLRMPAIANLCVSPNGLEAFLDFIDWYIQRRPPSQPSLEDILIRCYDAPGYSQVEKHYILGYDKYTSIKGLRLNVEDALTNRRITPGSRRKEMRLRV